MKFKNQDQLLALIKKAIKNSIERSQKNSKKKWAAEKVPEEQTAVFDADGTLWREDANQILLDYQIEREREAEGAEKVLFAGGKAERKNNSLQGFSRSNQKSQTGRVNQKLVDNKSRRKLEDLKLEDLLSDYYQKHHRHELCRTFLKKQAGLSFTEFQAQSERALSEKPLTVFSFQRELLTYLKKQGIKTVVLTASIQWLVELAVKKEGLPVDQVLGSRTELDSLETGLISDRIVRPSPGEDSKAEVFLKEYGRDSCLLATGNTPSDLPLLELAELSFVVHSAGRTDIIFPKEQKMKELALAKKWLLFEKEQA